MFISDYVYVKYNLIYQEAAALYNQINQRHPRKPDLRKTIEYRSWKNNIAASNNMPVTPIPREKKRVLIHMVHRNIPIDTAGLPDNTSTDMPTVEIPLTDNTQASSENPILENTVPENPSPTENPSPNDPRDIYLGGMSMQLNIPLMQVPTSTKTVHRPQETACEEITLNEGDQAEVLDPSVQETACEEITLDEGDQAEVLDPSILDPSILDEISPETMTKIIEELQREPNLMDIMAGIDNNIEEELVGLTIDLPDLPDPLEDELMFL